MLLESVIGFATLYTGIIYREFDKKSADEMLDIIRRSDRNYYEKLVIEQDAEYLQHFQNLFTKKRNTLLIVYGSIIILFSFGGIAPIGIMLGSLYGKKGESEKPEETEEREL